jgi:hypothetical protein
MTDDIEKLEEDISTEEDFIKHLNLFNIRIGSLIKIIAENPENESLINGTKKIIEKLINKCAPYINPSSDETLVLYKEFLNKTYESSRIVKFHLGIINARFEMVNLLKTYMNTITKAKAPNILARKKIPELVYFEKTFLKGLSDHKSTLEAKERELERQNLLMKQTVLLTIKETFLINFARLSFFKDFFDIFPKIVIGEPNGKLNQGTVEVFKNIMMEENLFSKFLIKGGGEEESMETIEKEIIETTLRLQKLKVQFENKKFEKQTSSKYRSASKSLFE